VDGNPPTFSLSRRQFVNLSLLAGSAAALAPAAGALARLGTARGSIGEPGKGLKILILGGTGLTGPQIIQFARPRGHHITVFNRGQTEKRKGSVGDDVDRLQGDRDPAKGDGLKALEGDRTWDVVIDNSGFFPRHVKASAELLKGRASHYIFVSTISAYNATNPPGSDESAPLAKLAVDDPENMAGGMNYGGLKVLCEQAVQEAFGDKACIVRPGLIVGPGDDTDRFTYWPVRVSKGGEVLAPNSPKDPIQYIDVRDLGEWITKLAENKTTGVYNAVDNTGLTIGKLLETCKRVSGSDAKFTWVKSEFLMANGVSPGMGMPCWIPPDSESAGIAQCKADKGVAKGLTFRSVETTVKDTLEWWPKEVERRTRVGNEMKAQAEKEGKPAPKLGDPKSLRAGITLEKEKEVLVAWAKDLDKAPAEKPG
jgi:2'-hydroxyisoflavone reductase